MNNKNPTVSVVIPTYNNAHVIKRCIKSVLNQTYQDFEIIVVDDASTDNTKNVIQEYSSQIIRYIKHDANKGGSAARNTGINSSNGEFVAFLDSDDEWLPEKLEKQLEMMNNMDNKEWGGIYSGHNLIFSKNIKVNKATKYGNLKKDLLKLNFSIGATSTLLFHRKAIDNIGLFDETFQRHQDWEYLIRFFNKYKLFAIEDPLVNVYGHKTPSIDKSIKMRKKYLSKFKKDIYEFKKKDVDTIFAIHYLDMALICGNAGDTKKCFHLIKKSINYKITSPKRYLSIAKCLILNLNSRIKLSS